MSTDKKEPQTDDRISDSEDSDFEDEDELTRIIPPQGLQFLYKYCNFIYLFTRTSRYEFKFIIHPRVLKILNKSINAG